MINNNNHNLSKAYSELKMSLNRLAYRYFKKPHDIEDVVQEAFVKVIEAQKKREIKYLNSYLHQTVKNLALKIIDKSEYKTTDLLGDFNDEPVLLNELSAEHQLESSQRFTIFCRAVRNLPLKCQRVYILRKVYGFTTKEIAAKLDISVKTVEAHLTKAIIQCTDFMDAEDELDNRSEHDNNAPIKILNQKTQVK